MVWGALTGFVSRGVELMVLPSPQFYEKAAGAKESTDRDLPTEETRLKLLNSATDTPGTLNFSMCFKQQSVGQFWVATTYHLKLIPLLVSGSYLNQFS